MMHGTRWKVAAGAAALAMFVTACGDDDEDAASTDTTAATEEGPDSEYCRLAAEFDESEGIPTIEDFEALGEAAPDAIREEVDAVIPVFQQYAEDDDIFGAFDDPIVEENIPAIEAYEDEVCGLGDDEGDDEEASDFVIAPEDEEYCAIATELNEQEDFPSPEQLEEIRAAAPEEIADEANLVVDAFLANQDDPFATFEDPAVQEAFGPIEAYDAEHCGLDSEDDGEEAEQDPSVTEADPSAAQVAVTAVDYEFQLEAPAAGRTQFTMTNEGDERHVMVLFKLADGATMDQVMESEGDEGIEGTELESDSAAPGETAILTTDLTPGNYGMICYIPNSDGVPHLALGMVKEFTIQ